MSSRPSATVNPQNGRVSRSCILKHRLPGCEGAHSEGAFASHQLQLCRFCRSLHLRSYRASNRDLATYKNVPAPTRAEFWPPPP